MFRKALFCFLSLFLFLHASEKPQKVVIIGAGITGLTAGIHLKQQGMEVTIYEKRKNIASIGGALSIWPNGAQTLLNLPCAEKVQKLAGNLRFENWGNFYGETLLGVDRDALQKINGYPFMNICRGELQHLLLETFGRENVIFDAACVGIEEDEHAVTVFLSKGEKVTADFLIGADGMFSTVRKDIFPEAKVDYTGYITLVGIFRFPENYQPQNHVIVGQNAYFLNFSVSSDRHMIYSALPFPEGILRRDWTKKEEIDLFQGWSEEVDEVLQIFKSCQESSEFSSHYFCSETYDMEPLDHWHTKRILLLGDAAHPMGSINGFAACLALENARIFSGLLETHSWQKALHLFEKKQLPRVKRFMEIELLKKNFLLNADESEYFAFQDFLMNASSDEFFKPIFEVMH